MVSAGKIPVVEWKQFHATGRENFKNNLLLGVLVWCTKDKDKKTPKLAFLGLIWLVITVI